MPRHALTVLISVAACAAGCGALPSSWFESAPGTVRGRVLVGETKPAGAEQPGVIVYLEPLEAVPAPAQQRIATIRQAPDGSWPPLAAVARGDQVSFVSHQSVRHRLFSSSSPNDFELDPGEQVRLQHQGELRFYCSLHPWESGLIFVTPSPWFATSSSDHYEIQGVPRGRYHLRTWSGADTELNRIVVVESGEPTAVDVDLPSRNGS